MSHLLSCPSCGLFGWRRHQRARSAAQMAERGLVAYWQGLGDRSRAERRSQRRWEARLIAAAYRHLDHAIAGGENAPSGPQSA